MTAAGPPPSGWEKAAVTSVCEDLGPLVEQLLADPSLPNVVFQPIVDLRRGVVAGYELLSRFPGPPRRGPEVWFSAAQDAGLGAQLEARVVRRALQARADLPANTFLSVNLGAHALCSSAVQAALGDTRDLRGLIVELTEHDVVTDYAGIRGALASHRAAGLRVAIDDTGSGYAGLQQLVAVRPDMVKLDRSLVEQADREEAKLALIQMVGAFAGRIDAWLLAEGVERRGELEACIRLGVPLAQGYLFGAPGEPWAGLAPALADAIRAGAAAAHEAPDAVVALLEVAPAVPHHPTGTARALLSADACLDLVVLVDSRRRPVGLLLRDDAVGGAPRAAPVHVVSPGTAVADLAARMLMRPAPQRFDPSVCCDGRGRYVGVVRAERLVERLIELSGRAPGGPNAGD